MIKSTASCLLMSALVLTSCSSGPSPSDAVVGFLRALDWDDRAQAQEFLHSEATVEVSNELMDMFLLRERPSRVNLLNRAWREVSDRDGIGSIEVVSERAVEASEFSDAGEFSVLGARMFRVETRITFGDGSEIEQVWMLAMEFERYGILEIPDLSG